MIDDETVVTVLEIRGNQVRLGFDAPPHIEVYREEIYKRIKDENKNK
jgi:carbon storage regulator